MYVFTLFFLSMLASATCSPTAQSLVNQCRAAGATAAANAGTFAASVGSQATGASISPSANGLDAAANQSAQQGANAVGACGTIYQRCSTIRCTTSTDTSSEQKTCASQIQTLANQFAAESTQAQQAQAGAQQTAKAAAGNGSSLSSSLLPAAAGALAGGLAGYMLGKSSSSSGSSGDSDTNAVSSGTLDCSADDAYRYTDCDSTFVSACYGSFTSTTACTKFSSRYCSSTTSSGNSVQASGTSNYYTADATGTGIGSTYCQYDLASAYCATSGRDSCPSCQMLPNFSSATCQNSPALCLAQNSASEIAAAKTTCPTDPVFSDPSFASYDTTSSTSTDSTVAVVLPQSVKAASAKVSDVSGQFGPSVFALGSAAITKWHSK